MYVTIQCIFMQYHRYVCLFKETFLSFKEKFQLIPVIFLKRIKGEFEGIYIK